MTTFSQTEIQLTSSQIEKVERIVGLDFPTEYRNHLLKYNGGQCDPNEFNFLENGKTTSSNVDWFLAIYDGEYDNLEDYINTYKIEQKRMPSRILPIAHDPGGNLVCISCEGFDVGQIYFWDHEKEVDYGISDDEDDSNMSLIAKSFGDFLNGLH